MVINVLDSFINIILLILVNMEFQYNCMLNLVASSFLIANQIFVIDCKTNPRCLNIWDFLNFWANMQENFNLKIIFTDSPFYYDYMYNYYMSSGICCSLHFAKSSNLILTNLLFNNCVLFNPLPDTSNFSSVNKYS